MPDIPGNSSTTASIIVGGVANDTLETIGDHDWFRIELTAGQKITITVDGLTLEDSLVKILSSGGTVLGENDDISAGVLRDSRLVYTAAADGTYYIDVGAFDDDYAGTYQLAVNLWTPPPVATIDTIAEHLTDGYWGGDRHHFNVTQGGTITYDFHDTGDGNSVTANGRTLAQEALALWSDIIGVTFVQVASGGQITFTDDEEGAFSDGIWNEFGITSSMHVNVSTQWLTNYGSTIGTYGFQTYIHEIGHALGLGHGGHYNSTADYGTDAEFANDGWPVTIMSYFDQVDNSYFLGQGFSFGYLNSPMIADIRGMADLYGLSTTTRTGDTIYGFGNNSGRAIYGANLGTVSFYTVVDSGGTDTLNYSAFDAQQTINLNAETFSNVGGGFGNVSIGFGTVIENAVGGSGNDDLTGNAANNVLTGNGGVDILTGGAGNDIFRDTKAGLTGDTIVDFTTGDSIVLTDAALAGFTFSLTGNTLTYTGGSLTLTGFTGQLTAAAAAGGGVQLTVQVSVNDVANDFNGDGRSDVMWRNDSGAFSVWQGAANGGFTASALSDSMISTSWQIAGSGDFNGDGRDDVLWRHSSGAFSQWLGLANGGFVANAAADALVAIDWQVAVAGDFNGDSYDDFIWRRDSGEFAGSFGQSNGSFTGNALSNTTVASSWHIVGAGDFNGDGRDDILWRNDSGAFSAWHGQADAGFVASANSDSVIATSWHIVGTGDFNGDGRDDVLWRSDSGAFSAWHGQANGGFIASADSNTVINTSWQVAGTGDFNGDGRDDVLWRSDSGAFSAWHGLANGGFVASANSNTVIDTSWHVQSPDILGI